MLNNVIKYDGWWTIGSLSNDEGDVKDSGKTAIDLDWQNNNSARASRFFVHSLPFLHDYDVNRMPIFTNCGGREHKRTTMFFFSWSSVHSFRIQLQKKLPAFDELNEME